MNKVLNYLKVTMTLLFISGIFLSTEIITVQAENVTAQADDVTIPTEDAMVQTDDVTLSAEDARHKTANLNIIDGKEVLMLRTSTGVVVDGHQLNHDYVKILNINNWSIVISDENYSQGAVSEPWSSQEDAYVVKGKGTSSNNITIRPTSNEITIYLVDIEWNGQIIVGGNACKVNIVLCGNNKNLNASSFISVQRYYGSLFVTGLTGREDNVTANTFLCHSFHDIAGLTRTVTLKDFTINTNRFFIIIGSYAHLSYYDGTLNFDNVVLNNISNLNKKYFVTINPLNSEIKI